MLFVTVPTRGDHPDLLESLIANSGVPREHVVVVRTDPTASVPTGVSVIDDSGPLNIHRWWNEGISRAVELGATTVAVLNDDLVIEPGSLQMLDEALLENGATLATPGASETLIRDLRSPARVIVGSLWLIDPRHGLRPSEDYRWFFGDDDLDVRARSRSQGIVTVPVGWEHPHAGEATERSSYLQELVTRDERTFRRQHPAYYAYRKAWERTQGRTGRLVRRIAGRPPL